jgi:hypothetical protein
MGRSKRFIGTPIARGLIARCWVQVLGKEHLHDRLIAPCGSSMRTSGAGIMAR